MNDKWDDLSPEEQLARANRALGKMWKALDPNLPKNKALERRVAALDSALDQHRAMARDNPEFRQAWIAQLLEKGATPQDAEEYVDRCP